MEVTANWQQGVEFEVNTSTGHTITVDGNPEIGGTNAGCRPMELMLASMATCSAIDVVQMLKKGKREFDGLSVKVVGERKDAVPAVFETIDLFFSVPGASAEHAKRAISLSVEKYCSALAMVHNNAQINWHYDENS